MKVRKYKIRNLVLLAKLQDELPAKYGKAGENVIDRLLHKTHELDITTLPDYLVTLMHLSNKYPELRVLLPSEEDVEEFLKREEQSSGATRG